MIIAHGNDGITIDELRDKIDQQFQQFQQFYANDEALNFDMTSATMSTEVLIAIECQAIKDMLIEKNRKYGDSVLSPIRLFSNASNDEQINVRIDDKLSRIKSAQGDDLEDAEKDLIGYLILKRVLKAKAIK